MCFLHRHHHKRKANKLTAEFIINGYKIYSTTMATITIPGSANSVNGQLVPLAAGVAQPITAIQAGSEAYTISDPTLATVAPISGTEGAFTVARVPGTSGTVTLKYSANNTAGTSISGSDDFVFEAPAPPPPPVADALSATYSTPV